MNKDGQLPGSDARITAVLARAGKPRKNFAVLAAGYETAGTFYSGEGEAPLSVLSHMGALLHACDQPWRIVRMAAALGTQRLPDRANWKVFADELVAAEKTGILAVSMSVTEHDSSWALVTGHRWREYPDDATLSLDWLAHRLRQCQAEQLLVLLSVTTVHGHQVEADELLTVVATDNPQHVIAVHINPQPQLLQAGLSALRGEVTDVKTGTPTLCSIGEYLSRCLPDVAVQSSQVRADFLYPPLGALEPLTNSVVIPGPNEDEDDLASQDRDDLTGQVLRGGFHIQREIASGAFGVVYEARQMSVDRPVAVKVLSSQAGAAQDDIERFLRECQTLGRLDHPGVVRIYHADITVDGRPFLAMELLPGRSLGKLLKDEGKLAESRAVDIARQVLRGLDAVHAKDIIHSDIKPENIMVVPRPDGSEQVVLLDFGMAFSRARNESSQSQGGTPVYMAPEQLFSGKADARSDLFAVGLVLYEMLTGWSRRISTDVIPVIETQDVANAQIRDALTHALAEKPEERFQGAQEFIETLAGKRMFLPAAIAKRSPFRHLSALTENDEGRLFGRDKIVSDLIAEHLLYGNNIVFTAASGTGKTSLLRAGLVPHLRAMRLHPVYLICREGIDESLIQSLSPGAPDVTSAVEHWLGHNSSQLVIVLDQVEALFLSSELSTDAVTELFRTVVDVCHRAGERAVCLLSIREDFLARLITLPYKSGQRPQVVRLGPLGRAGARAAIIEPLTRYNITLEPTLREQLLNDLQAAGAKLKPQMGWGQEEAIYPPHLQLACAVLYDNLKTGEDLLTLKHYQLAGGLDAIIAESLDRVLDKELDDTAASVAKEIFLELVTTSQTRESRSEAYLLHKVGTRHGEEQVKHVIDVLRQRGLLLPIRLPKDDKPGWELVHDSLIPRILTWTDRRDLDRRRAKELLRFRLRQARDDQLSLLNGAELRHVLAQDGLCDELDDELGVGEPPPEPDKHGARTFWTPNRLVSESRRALRRRNIKIALLLVSVGLGMSWLQARHAHQREQDLKSRNLGRFHLILEPFDWDVETHSPRDVSGDELSALTWQLYEPDNDNPDKADRPISDYTKHAVGNTEGQLRYEVNARGGPAFVRITGRGRDGASCPPSWIRGWLPGYATRDESKTFLIRVPTCQATYAETIDIPAGQFFYDSEEAAEIKLESGFQIDRTEVINAAYELYASMSTLTRHTMPTYPTSIDGYQNADQPDRPVGFVFMNEARDYCRFLGKELPTNPQWQKAARGGIFLDRKPNLNPRRKFPWGTESAAGKANLKGDEDGYLGTAPVGQFPTGASPYGVLDMIGNVREWTRTPVEGMERMMVVHGGSFDTDLVIGKYTIGYNNMRDHQYRAYELGFRCVLNEPGETAAPSHAAPSSAAP